MKNLQDEFKKLFPIPFSYAIFLIACIKFLFSRKLYLVNLNYFFSNNIQKMILQIFDFIYSHNVFYWFSVVLIVTSIFLYVLSYTNVYNYVPEDAESMDGKTISWNYVSAVKRPLYKLWDYFTIHWVWFFIFNVLFDDNNFINDFWTYKYLSENINIAILFFLNVIVLCYHVISALFKIEIDTWLIKVNIDSNELRRYICLDAVKMKDGLVAILRTKDLKKTEYLLVTKSSVTYSRVPDEDSILLGGLKKNKTSINIESVSYNLEDIKIQFESIKNENIPIADKSMPNEFYE